MRISTPLLKTLFYGMTATFLAASFMIFPEEAFQASLRGLDMWWHVVFPSLLPFFIISEFLIRFGVVSFIGALFEPIMRPLFRVPGIGGFVWAMGLASGFPAGAKLTARMREEGKITATEGERLVSFTNASNPLFIFGAVAVGFFHNPQLGIVLASAHYGGNIIVGLMMRFYKGNESENNTGIKDEKDHLFSIKKAVKLMHYERINDTRPFGKMMGDAVSSSIQTLLMVGGFIILFSVLNEILSTINITMLVGALITIILQLIQMPAELSPAIISGLFEITLGSQIVSETVKTTLLQQAIITSFILAFNGFSVQAQVASILSETDIRFKPFFLARCFHGFISAGLTYFLFDFLYVGNQDHDSKIASPVFYMNESVTNVSMSHYTFLLQWGGFITLTSLVTWILWQSYRMLRA